uniref:MBD domain-containing protein n=1 Tax=Kalanchoe fedtschenkoi TaxID=63787 RepID=A0A7N0UP53_KALFE
MTMDLRDPELERLQEEAKRIHRHPTASSSKPPSSDMQMVVWGQPALRLQQIATGEVVRRRRRTARIPKKFRWKWKGFRLPSDWAIEVKNRSTGKTAGRKDKYYVAPDGSKTDRSDASTGSGWSLSSGGQLSVRASK